MHAATYKQTLYPGTSFPSNIRWACLCGKKGVISDGKQSPSMKRAKAAYNAHKLAEAKKAHAQAALEVIQEEQPAKTALRNMQEKVLEGRSRGSLGYVTDGAELKKILAELSERIPVGIISTGIPEYGAINFEIKIGFCVEPDLLDHALKG